MSSSQMAERTDSARDPGGPRKARVAIVVSHPIQHFVPFYRALARQGEIDLRVFFASTFALKPSLDAGFNMMVQWDVDLLGGYEHEFFEGADEVKELTFRRIDNPRVGRKL